ncbi:MAG: TrmH family RNA methyltransferase [Gammaproteobacteria bacterium]|nr:TrmH family RNA methyltransferase [Gammaproteobacteria bacterium]MCW8909434.1 TrmH family RNA methyltransferase [Gammaproteobacteria bacterium]MCW9004522.1 TrmH family RNA methyltransferase [Gammaproteobacteria bacterium]MCW9056204.1 TrmH family RNA methyltransferase [Gammaproteobacteria bacterium]
MKQPKVSIGLTNPKSPKNVASVMRAAGNYGVGEIFYTGTRYDRAVMLNPDTPNLSRSVGQAVSLTAVSCLIDAVSEDVKIICVEFAEDAIALPEYKHPENALYVFGPEDGTLGQDVIDRADDVVYVPTMGCMNLAASVNVLLYDRLAKSFLKMDGNDLIRQSRDTNNRLKVKKI